MPSSVSHCACGRVFKDTYALHQHQRDAHHGANIPEGSIAQGNCRVQYQAKQTQSKPAGASEWLTKGTGTEITQIFTSSLGPSKVNVTIKEQTELLCSYNWVEASSKAICVPGGAALWNPIPPPFVVPKDSGLCFIDENAYKMPQYPFEPVFRAIEAMRIDCRFDDIDVLINRNSLRKLLDFCANRYQSPFRLNLYLISKTLIIERQEKSPALLIRDFDDSGFGRNFEREATSMPEGLEHTASHHRVLQYNLGDLSCAVRCEVDAQIYDPVSESSTTSTSEDIKTTDVVKEKTMRRMNGKQRSAKSLRVIHQGREFNQANTAEIKTFVRGKRRNRSSWMPQLWFGRTPYLIKAQHRAGIFEDISVANVQERLVDWESSEQNQMALRRVVRLISWCRSTTRAAPGQACVAVYKADDESHALRLYEVAQPARRPLPEDIIEKFWSDVGKAG